MRDRINMMRRVIFESSISRDGFIEGPAGELDWVFPDTKHEGRTSARRLLSCFDTIFFGRKTYEKIGLFDISAPHLSGAEKEMFYLLHGMRKYVFSRTMKHVPGNAMVISTNLREEVLRIREEEGKDIWLWCGADLLETFVKLDLVDEYILSVQPVLLHSGKPLFQGNKRPVGLNLVNRHNLRSGVVILHYASGSKI